MGANESQTSRREVPTERVRSADPSAADWRVLLPVPETGTFGSLLLLGGAPALAAFLVEIGLTRQVCLRVPCDGPVDAVALLSGSSEIPGDVVRYLRPDAVLYWEIEQAAGPLLRRRLSRIRELLRHWGFSDWTFYKVHPNFRNCESYCPLDARNAEHWYSRQKAARPSFRVRLPWQNRGPRSYALVAVRGQTQSGAAARGILTSLPAELLPSAARVLVVNRRGRRNRKRRLVVFAFSESDRQPIGVIKVSRTPTERNRIDAEQSALASIRGLLDNDMKASLPEPLACLEAANSRLGVETYLNGERRARGFTERRRVLELAASWITEFHRQTEISRGPWGSAECEKWIVKPIAEYRLKFEAGDPEHRLFEALIAHGRELRGETLPLVWCHGDFNESNVLFTDATLRVVDWESATVGLPLFDLLYFAANWMYRLTEPAGRLRRFREVIVSRRDGDEISRVIWGTIAGYCAKLGVDLRFTPLLIALHFIRGEWPQEVALLAEGLDRLFRGREA
jgi:aminoglycoside phosphotransferase (APT) family kinase protein